ncbi:hypothetical protein PIB30_086032 [Stylosanthes scabra]|uniref:Putative plant transposon protein domain-containing protein n=1 Tax=Stylosanthes scabra TaxID=79078 RepID=A0ABU6XSE9_9FABA|nr:hypothetical protein [Stylosanthes scabra]
MASSSRKRKGKSAQNYESAKFISLFPEDHYNRYTIFIEVLPEARIQVDHADFAPMSEQITLRKWQRLTRPIQAVGYSFIREFYTNAWIRDEERNQKQQNDLRLDDVLRDLCIEGAQWVFHDDGRHHFLRKTYLKPMARGWYEFVIRSIMPIRNRFEVTVERAVLIHSIILSEDIQVNEIIAEQIYKFVNKIGIRTKLPFPGVIQHLCDEKRVSIPEATMIPVEPHINSKWIERVRRERAGRREAPPPEQQNEEAAEIPQAPQFQQGFPPNFMADFNNAMAAMQLQSNQRWDAFQQRFGAAQEEN